MKKILTCLCFFLLVFNLSFAAPKSKNANNNLDIFEDESEYIDNLRAEVEAEFEYQKKEMEKELARQKAEEELARQREEMESELEALALKKAESEAYYEAQIENEKISYMYSHPYEFAELFVPSYNTADAAKVFIESADIQHEGKEYKALHFYGNTGTPVSDLHWYGFTRNEEYDYLFKDYIKQGL